MVVKKGIPFLYNLATDIHEDNNVADQHPEIVEKIGEAGGAEVKENNISVWLTPAINKSLSFRHRFRGLHGFQS